MDDASLKGKAELLLVVREGQMFILSSHEMKSTMYAKGRKDDTNIELWHKRIGHISLEKLKGMQSKGVVIRLPTFTEKEMASVCDACQFKKQHRQLFAKERNVSKGTLDIVHSDAWGPSQTITFGGCLDIMSRSSKTSPGIPRFTLCSNRTTCSDTSKGLRMKAKRLLIGMSDAFDQTTTMSISLMLSQLL